MASENPPATKTKEHPYQAIGCLLFVPLLAIGLFAALFVALYLVPRYLGTKDPRATVSYLKDCFHYFADEAARYYQKNGHFPPELNEKSFYGPSTSVFGAANSVNFPAGLAQGPLVDPHRDHALFPGEKKSTALYHSTGHPEGWVKLQGYPPRYFRSRDGRWAMLIGNGPDGRATLPEETLKSREAGVTNPSILMTDFAPYSYDPTNGANSEGDVWRLLEPS